jgi:hypothetical protein
MVYKKKVQDKATSAFPIECQKHCEIFQKCYKVNDKYSDNKTIVEYIVNVDHCNKLFT